MEVPAGLAHDCPMGPRARLTVIVLAICGVILPPATASAVSAAVTCAGTETVTYQPGVLLAPQNVSVTINGILAPCTSSDPTITSGTYLHNVNAVVSCSTVLAAQAGTRVFQWSNGQSSTFSYNRTVNNVGGQTTVTFTGTIVSGQFTGATVIQQVVLVTPNSLQCLAPPGLTALGPGVSVLTINTV